MLPHLYFFMIAYILHVESVVQQTTLFATQAPLSSLLSIPYKKLQVENYKHNKSIILNIHITHHAGTLLCGIARRFGPTPSFNCMDDGTKDHNFDKWRQKYHYISWEYTNAPRPSLSSMDWTQPNLLTIFIARHPMDRLLSWAGLRNPKTGVKFGHERARSAEDWDLYAHGRWTDNYALRILSDNDITEHGLNKAKALASKFTFIFDQACLDLNLASLGPMIGWDNVVHNGRYHHMHGSPRERIHNDTLWKWLRKRNELDIKFYEWAKTMSLVQCS